MIESKTLAVANARIELLEARIVELEAERRRLTDIIVDMKREGFMPPAAAYPDREIEETRLPAPIMLAISQVAADPKDPVWMQLVREAEADMRVEGAVPEEIATKILDGGTFNPWSG